MVVHNKCFHVIIYIKIKNQLSKYFFNDKRKLSSDNFSEVVEEKTIALSRLILGLFFIPTS